MALEGIEIVIQAEVFLSNWLGYLSLTAVEQTKSQIVNCGCQRYAAAFELLLHLMWIPPPGTSNGEAINHMKGHQFPGYCLRHH